jgi:RecA-superfamily ATPases implicated in signal transduction
MVMDLNVEGRSERIPPGSHICQMYSKVTEIPAVTAHLLHVGLDAGEKCLFAAATEQVEQVRDDLQKAQVDVEAYEQRGQLILTDDRDQFLSKNDRFDPYYLLSTHQTFIAHAMREGWKGARISIDMNWLMNDVVKPELILKYEAASDAVFTFQGTPIIALMHYDYTKILNANLVVELLKLHPIAVVGKFIRRNPYYINSEDYMLKILRLKKGRKSPGTDLF